MLKYNLRCIYNILLLVSYTTKYVWIFFTEVRDADFTVYYFAVFCDARFFTKECIAKIAVIQFHTLQQLHKSIWHNNLQSVCFSSIYSPDKYASRSLVFHS